MPLSYYQKASKKSHFKLNLGQELDFTGKGQEKHKSGYDICTMRRLCMAEDNAQGVQLTYEQFSLK